ncbi:MAG: hypothetical protein JNL43_16155 [Flavobacteriales bacterium]|nr:hypothetical protein [Flavobacteriales bacterium]
MRILIYSAEPRGAVDEYTIRRLISEGPQHDYFLLSVHRPRPKVTFLVRCKRRLVELRDGPNHWLRAIERLDRSIRSELPAVDPRSLPGASVNAVNDGPSRRWIEEFQPDIIVQAGAGILKPEVFTLAKLGTLNVHHGVAPEIRGMRSTFWCLYYGLTDLIGVTCHKIDATLDTGEIILQQRYEPKAGEGYVDIQLTLCRMGADLLLRSIDQLERHDQAPSVRSEVDSFYFSELAPEQFNALHRNGYRRVADPSTLPRKRKVKQQPAFT